MVILDILEFYFTDDIRTLFMSKENISGLEKRSSPGARTIYIALILSMLEGEPCLHWYDQLSPSDTRWDGKQQFTCRLLQIFIIWSSVDIFYPIFRRDLMS